MKHVEKICTNRRVFVVTRDEIDGKNILSQFAAMNELLGDQKFLGPILFSSYILIFSWNI